ncbi:hypothetical protein [Roseomonas sp. HF4]|uniref:hypothetical protein n=1 Tax=Roseomonas sp. HF4 TaxID=2562313 RepID=UPI0014853D39|nr:hypothetical protein [Roseomonas sp. HF4]
MRPRAGVAAGRARPRLSLPSAVLAGAVLMALIVGLGVPAAAQMAPSPDDPTEGVEEPPAVVMSAPFSIPCSEVNNRAMEATLVIRQHASVLSVGFDAEGRADALVLLAWLDQWAGRLRGLIDLGEFSQCLDDGDAETYRRALASASAIANQAREEFLRPVRPRPRR